jgi:hypothetical protein
MSFEEAMGFPKEEPPQQPPIWTTEYYKRGSRNAQYFPIPQPQYTPEQIAELQRLYQEQLAAANGQGTGAADVRPDDPPPPASTSQPPRRRPTLRDKEPADPVMDSEPQIPYRPSEPAASPLPRSSPPLPRSNPQPRTSPLPRSTPSGSSGGADPIGGDVMP